VKVTVAPLAIVLAAGILSGGHADAQVRVRGGVRVGAPRARAVVVVGGYYRRPFYDPFYDPFYFNSFYRPYYRPFYWYPQAAYGQRIYEGDASLRLQVSPRETEVYIDNYYAGTVDDFDGIFQRLHIEPGSHDITLYLDGYRTVHQRIYLQPSGSTFRLRYMMQPLGPGDVAEPRPVEPPPPQPQPQAGPAGPGQGGPNRYPPPPQRGGPPPRPDGRAQGPPPQQGDRSDMATLSVRVQPANADVLIDGERWDGPAGDERLVVQVSPGLHHVEVRREGYRTYQSDIEVRPGETSTVNVSLSRQ
jgi:hypothetical protein